MGSIGSQVSHLFSCIVILLLNKYWNSPSRPYTNHANFFMDGGIITDPRDHAITAKRMFILHAQHLLRQLPYQIKLDSKAMCESIQIKVGDEWIKTDDWAHFPSEMINDPEETIPTPQPNVEEGSVSIPESSQFPSRSAVFEDFVNGLYKYSKAIPDIAAKGVSSELPQTLKSYSKDFNTFRPSTHRKYYIYLFILVLFKLAFFNRRF